MVNKMHIYIDYFATINKLGYVYKHHEKHVKVNRKYIQKIYIVNDGGMIMTASRKN